MLAIFTHLTSSMPFSFFPLTLYTVGLYGRPSFVHSIFPIFLTSGSASSILGLPFALSGQSIKKTVDILPRLFWKTSDFCILCANSRIEIATYEHRCNNIILHSAFRENIFAIVFVNHRYDIYSNHTWQYLLQIARKVRPCHPYGKITRWEELIQLNLS